ncbi:gliding motility-associated C-terminal domain-containing protein, partial [Chitinophaga terrae (ex Kim and Jung 2007)]
GIAVTVYNDNTVVKTTTLSSLLTLRLLGGNRFVATVPTGGVYDRVEIKLTGVANLLTSLNIYGVRAVSANPTVAASSQTVCQNLPATLSATPAAGTTLQWFKDSTGGVALSNQNTYVTDTLKTAGTVKYYLQVIGSNNCPNPERIPVTVTVNPLGTPGDITVADTTASCGSAPAVLTPVANGVTNPVFTWYANANKTTKITNGAVIGGATFNVDTTTGRLTITGLTTGTHTYYVSVSGTNRCENPAGSLKAVTVNVSGAPAPPTVVQNYNISTGLPLTLNAAPAPGTTVLWYSDTTLAPIGRGNTITLAPFVSPGVYTYFAGDSLPGGCVSYRLPITITVTGPSPIKCNMPNSQLTGTTLGCVLCSVTNPENDVDSINTNFTRLNIPVGLLGGSVYQRLIFPAAGAASDSLTFDLASPGGLADVSVLGGALITVYNGNTVVSTHPISQLLTLRLLSGNRYTATVPAGGAYDRVEVKLTGVANLLNSLDIYGVRAIAPDPAITATNVTVCQGQPAVLTATPAAGTSVKWYADSTSTVVLSSNATYTTDTLKTPGNFRYYVQAIGANGCPNPDRIPVVVTVYPTSQPGNINIADTTVACSSEPAVLTPTATGVTAPVFKWYKDNNKTAPITNGMVENGVTYAIDTTGKLTITGLAAGNYKYFVSVSSATQCENPAGALKAANVKIAAAPAAPVVSGQITIQVNTQGVVKAQPVPGATIVWFADATTNTVLATGDSLVVGPFSTPGLYTYYAAARVAGACDSKRSPVQVQVVGPFNPDPNCNFANAQSSGTTLGCILCSVMNPTNDVDSDHSNFTRLSVPVGALGGSAYQRLIFANPGSANDSIQLQLATPVGLADVSLLGGTLISLYNNNTLVKSDTLSRLLTLRLLNGQQFTATIAAPAAYDRVEVRLTGVLNLLNAIDIYSARVLYAKPTVKATMDTVCINSKATLSVTPAAGTSVRWYADSTSNVVLSTQNTYTTDTLKTAGKVTYYVAVVGGPNNCPNPDRIPVSVYVTPAPSVPGAPVVVQVCPGSSVDLQVANADRRFTYNWYNVPTGGNKLNTDSGYTFRLTAVSRDTVLYVAAVNSCGAISDRQQFTVQMAPSLSAPVVTPNPDSVAIGTQAVLTATSNTANVIFKWYGSQAGNDSLFTGPVYTPTSNTAGTVTYWVEASLNGGSTCKSIRVPVVVVYGTRPTSSVPCEGASSQSVGSSGLLVLGGVYNQGLSVDNDANTASSLVIDAGLLNAQVWQRAKFVGVSAPGDTVKVLLSNPSQVLSAALLGGVQITSYNGSTPGDSVSVNNPLVKLVILSSKKQALIEFVPTKPFDAVEVKLKSGILGALTTIDFNYAQRALVAPKVQAANVTACAGGTATLNVQDPVTGITYRWYNSQGVYLTGKDGSSFTTGNLTKDTAFYVEAFRNNCASSSRTRVDVKVTAAPVAPAVLATNVEVCSGSDAVLAVANPVRGYSYAWYNVASGGTKLNTDSGFTYKVVNVTAKATYYVEAINDSCHTVSATRTAVTVNTAAALAPPTVDPSVDTIVIGQQGLFRASAAVANAEFNWYASDTSTNILFTGSTFTTPKATALGRTVYYVEAVLPGGATCKSARVPATVVVINGDPSIVPCEGATSEINGRTGITIGSVVNPEFAVDDKISTASSLVINLGVGNGSVYQRAMFKGISTAGDTVKVMLSNPGQILSAAVLASVQLTTYNGNTAGDSVLVSNPLVHLDLLSNSRRAILSFVPTKPFDGVEVKLRSGILGALTAVDFNYAQRAIAQPKVQVNGSATICKGKQATLAVVNPAAGIVYSWYDSKGVHLADSVAYVTPATLGTGTYNYFVTASRNNCTSAASAQVAVTVLGLPSAPVPVANDVKTCINTPVTLSVQPVTGVQFNWYDAATGGAKLASNSNTYTTPANLPAGTYNFFVEAVNASNCANDSARTKIVVTVDSAATAVDIVANDQVICNGQNAVLTPSSTTVQNPVFKWYANPDKTGPITAGVDSKGVLTITGLTPGAYTYYVSVSNNGRCENQAGNLKAVKVTVNSNAVAADINVADTTICLNTTVKLTATSTTVTNPVFKWYKDATLSTLLFTGATYTTDQLTATTSYYVTVEGANKCANSAANAKVVTVNVREVNTPVIAASSISICAGDTATLSIQNAENGVTYKWYNTATGGTAIFTGPVYVVRGLTQSTDFYAEASVGSCTSATRTKVSIGVGVAPKPIVESTDVTVCQGGSAILKVTSSTTNITYKWYTTATGGTAVFTGPIFTAGPITTNTAYYVEAIGDTSKCGKPSERVKVNVTAVPVPAAPVLVSSTVQGCVGQSATLAIKSPVPGTTYQWYDAPTNGTLVFEGEVFNIASIDSTVTYYVQASVNGSCPSATRTSATIRANSIPAVPEIAASSLTVCQGGSVTLSIKNPVAGVTYRWYDALTGGKLLFTGSSFTTGALDKTTDFYAEASNGACSSNQRAKITVGVGQAPTPVLESNALTVCTGSTATLRVTSATNGVTYKWYTQASGGTPVFTGPVYTTDKLTTSTDYYVEAVGDAGSCGSPSARVKASVTVVPAPDAPDVVATSLKTCAGTGVTVAVKTVKPGITYQWYDAPQGGSLLFTGAVYSVQVVTANTTYYVQANLGSGCASSTRTAVNVSVDPAPPVPTVASDNETTCIGGTVTFTVTNPGASTTYRWYDAPSGGTLLATGTAYTTAPLAATTTIYLEALNSFGCSSVRKGLTATVVNDINAPLVDPITVCAGQSGVLQIKNRSNNVIYRWYTVPTGGTAVFTGADFTVSPTSTVTYYAEAATSGGCISASRTPVKVTVNPSPAAPAVADASPEVCAGQSVVLNVLNPDATLTYKWYTTPTGGTPVATGAMYPTNAINTNQMFYVEATNNNACPSPTRTAVSVLAIPAPAIPTVTGNTSICPGSSATLTAASTTAGVNFRWYSVANGGTPLFTGTSYTTQPLNTATTYYVEAFTAGGCVSATRKAVDVTMAEPLPAPTVTVDNATATAVTFRWNAVTGAQRYEVSVDNGVTFIPPSSGANGTTHTISNLQPNQSVSIQVRAIGTVACENSALASANGKSTNPNGNNIFVPNLFSPNGDGMNDIMYVYGTSIAQLEFRIYNQWGQLVFTSKDQRQGWDGTMSGQRQPVGVYVYIVKATMQDGTVVTKKGNVTLMR